MEENIVQLFYDYYSNTVPMSFFGGGTDFEGFYKEHGGAVISTTFNKYCYVTVRHLPRFFEYKTHLTYSKTETVNENDEIQHPAIRNAMNWLDMHEIRMTYESDLPARSGLGTSLSFAVGMLEAFYALKGKYADSITNNTSEFGGGVVVDGAIFIMKGGSISGNTATNSGGGVYVSTDATFNQNGGSVTGNTPDNVFRAN